MAVHGIAHLYISTFGRGQAMCCHIDITLYSSQCNNCILRAWKSILNNATGYTGRRTVQHGVKSSLRYISQDTAAHHWMAPAIQYLQVLWIVSSEHSELSVYYIRKNLPALPSCSMPKHAWQGSHDIRWQKHAWQALKLSFSACHGWRLLYKACQYWSTQEMAFLAQGTICMVFVSGFSYGLWCLTCFFLFLLQLSYSITPRQ